MYNTFTLFIIHIFIIDTMEETDLFFRVSSYSYETPGLVVVIV